MRIDCVFWACALALGGCASTTVSERPETRPETAARAPAGSSGATLVVKGMSCPNCATNVDKQLLALRGVSSAEVNLGTGEVVVGFSAFEEAPSDAALRGAIVDSGYTLGSIRRY